MSIKSTIIERRMRKAATPGELYFADRLIAAAKELLAAEHAYKTDTAKRELTTHVAGLYDKIAELIAKLETDAAEAVKTAKGQAKRDAQEALAQVLAVKEDCENAIARMCSESERRITAKVDTIFNNLEQFRGAHGIPGKPGERGADGSPDTPDEVVEKVNTAGKKVKLSAIEGLAEELRKAKRENSGKAGGGMGNPQHETYLVGSSTTSITLSYPVAAGGRAAWVYYQGQWLVYGTHYTILGSTLSPLLPITDGTYIDILYMRGS